ncbi:toll/interleukin-1 receptor domain-containing protein [Fundidesulfovibrio agrisoli]|uniref:toll/interleukin-1 receptor domain-containing protein n=1 Tax=Fundidesulfovibrio agrisoli TaxID=2922717 RepID=UPI001FAD79A9|nr:toll/interleukin-1 receptor domain-containing protein [Fundidesulfovibrio agrisoli]
MNSHFPVRRRIFISYGHDEHAELALRLKRDLTASGHEVWIDSEGIIPGTPDWEHSIEKGIAWLAEAPEQHLSGLSSPLFNPPSRRRRCPLAAPATPQAPAETPSAALRNVPASLDSPFRVRRPKRLRRRAAFGPPVRLLIGRIHRG